MDQEAIDNTICEIMHHDGPDRHIDGHEKITEFVMALLSGSGHDWAAQYAAKHKPTRFM